MLAASAARLPDRAASTSCCACGDAGGRDRYAIIDYKTNWLAAGGRAADRLALPARQALALEMQRSHYVLQALLYSVALHRYLRWRLPGYDPDARPRGRPLPVPARHARASADRMRGVRLAPAGGAGRGASDLLAGERIGMSVLPSELEEALEQDPFGPELALRAAEPLRRVQPEGSWSPPTCTSRGRCSLARIAGEEPREVRCSCDALPCGRRGSAGSSSTCSDLAARSPSSTRSRRSRRCRGPTSPTGLRRCRPRRAGGGRRGRNHRTPPAAAARLAAVPRPLLARGASAGAGADGARGRHRWRVVDLAELADAIARLFSDDDGDLHAARRRRRRAAARADRDRRRPRHRQDHTVARIVALIASGRGERGAPPPLVALCAPTGKAAARLQEAVRDEAAADVDRSAPRSLRALRRARSTACSASPADASATTPATACRTTS